MAYYTAVISDDTKEFDSAVEATEVGNMDLFYTMPTLYLCVLDIRLYSGAAATLFDVATKSQPRR